MPLTRPPELAFQEHVAAFLVREHKYGVLEQTDITDTENFVLEDHLYRFAVNFGGLNLGKLPIN